MKTKLILAALLLLPCLAFAADGPVSITFAATTTATVVPLQDVDFNASRLSFTVVCPDDGITVSHWQHTPAGVLDWLGDNFGPASPDTAHAPAGLILPFEGKIHYLVITTDTGAADVDIHFYNE